MVNFQRKQAHDGAPDGDGQLQTITQALLAEYEELKPKAERFKVPEEQIKAALDDDVPVESGRLVAKLNVYYRKRLLQNFIFEYFGLSGKEIDNLFADAPAVRHRSLAVVPAHSSPQVNQPIPATFKPV